jgi:hypothetical protein
VRFSNQQHRFYGGSGLHARPLAVVAEDADGTTLCPDALPACIARALTKEAI